MRDFFSVVSSYSLSMRDVHMLFENRKRMGSHYSLEVVTARFRGR